MTEQRETLIAAEDAGPHKRPPTPKAKQQPKPESLSSVPAPAPPAIMSDAWMSLEEFRNEVVPVPIRSVIFAGFAQSIRTLKQYNYRQSWRTLLNNWLATNGFEMRA